MNKCHRAVCISLHFTVLGQIFKMSFFQNNKKKKKKAKASVPDETVSPPQLGCSAEILAALEPAWRKWRTPFDSQTPQSPHRPGKEKRERLEKWVPAAAEFLSLSSRRVSSASCSMFIQRSSLCWRLYSHFIYDNCLWLCQPFEPRDLWWTRGRSFAEHQHTGIKLHLI